MDMVSLNKKIVLAAVVVGLRLGLKLKLGLGLVVYNCESDLSD